MKEEIAKVRQEVIKAQKEAVIKDIIVLETQLDFMNKEHDKKVKETKDKEKKEALAQYKLQKLIPMQDNIDYKSKYYDYLCNLK